MVNRGARIPTAKRTKYANSRRIATGRGTSTTSPITSLGMVEGGQDV